MKLFIKKPMNPYYFAFYINILVSFFACGLFETPDAHRDIKGMKPGFIIK